MIEGQLTQKKRIIINMQYLITTNSHPPFFTKWFEPENHFSPELEMVVYDLINHVYTTDGETWEDIFIDHL